MRRKISAGILLGITSLTLAGCTSPMKAVTNAIESTLKGCVSSVISCALKILLVVAAIALLFIICKVLFKNRKAISNMLHNRKARRVQEQNTVIQDEQDTSSMYTIKKVNSNNDRMDSF